MANDRFNPDEYQSFKASAQLNEDKGFDPKEYESFKEGSPKFYEIEKQPGLPHGPVELIKQAARQFKDAATSPMPGSLLTLPVKAMQDTANQAGADVARATQPTIGTIPARAAGFATSTVLDPTSYLSFGGAAKVAGKGLDAAAAPVGKQVARMAEGASNVPMRNIIKLFEDPKAVRAALSTEKAGAELNAAKRLMGVTPEQEFLIDKAGSRSPGVSRTVMDEFRKKVNADFVARDVNPADIKPTDPPIALYIGRQDYGPGKSVDLFDIHGNHPQAKSTVSRETLEQLGIPIMGRAKGRNTAKMAPAAINDLSVGELMALNRAAGKVARETKGSEKFLSGQLKGVAQSALEEKAKVVTEALKQYSMAKTKQSFQSLVPLTKSGKADYLKMVGSMFTGLATSPAGVGVATRLAGPAYRAGRMGSQAAAGTGAVALNQSQSRKEHPHLRTRRTLDLIRSHITQL